MEGRGLNLYIAECNEITDIYIKTSEPKAIVIDYLPKVKFFTLDLNNKRCFLELDRFDKRVFFLAKEAPKLERLVLRTGTKPLKTYSHAQQRY